MFITIHISNLLCNDIDRDVVSEIFHHLCGVRKRFHDSSVLIKQKLCTTVGFHRRVRAFRCTFFQNKVRTKGVQASNNTNVGR